MVALLVWAAATYAGDTLGIVLSGSDTYVTALIFAVILSLINTLLGGFLRVVTFPLNFLTLGLVYFFITLFMIYVTDAMYDNIAINGFLGYIVIAFIPSVASLFMGRKK